MYVCQYYSTVNGHLEVLNFYFINLATRHGRVIVLYRYYSWRWFIATKCNVMYLSIWPCFMIK